MNNPYNVIDIYRRAKGWSWEECPARMRLDINHVTIFNAATGRTVKPRPLYAKLLDRWIATHRAEIDRVLREAEEDLAVIAEAKEGG